MLAAGPPDRRTAAADGPAETDDDDGLMPPLVAGPLVLDSGGVQSVQVFLDGARSDDVVGDRFAVVVRSPRAISPEVDGWRAAGAVVVDASIDTAWVATLDAFTPPADVAVVRPDRYVLAQGAVAHRCHRS